MTAKIYNILRGIGILIKMIWRAVTATSLTKGSPPPSDKSVYHLLLKIFLQVAKAVLLIFTVVYVILSFTLNILQICYLFYFIFELIKGVVQAYFNKSKPWGLNYEAAEEKAFEWICDTRIVLFGLTILDWLSMNEWVIGLIMFFSRGIKKIKQYLAPYVWVEMLVFREPTGIQRVDFKLFIKQKYNGWVFNVFYLDDAWRIGFNNKFHIKLSSLRLGLVSVNLFTMVAFLDISGLEPPQERVNSFWETTELGRRLQAQHRRQVKQTFRLVLRDSNRRIITKREAYDAYMRAIVESKNDWEFKVRMPTYYHMIDRTPWEWFWDRASKIGLLLFCLFGCVYFCNSVDQLPPDFLPPGWQQSLQHFFDSIGSDPKAGGDDASESWFKKAFWGDDK